jgi:hypothetical protein
VGGTGNGNGVSVSGWGFAPGVMSAQGQATACVQNGSSNPNTMLQGVIFDRSFSLSGSPGWNVTLSGYIAGILDAHNTGLKPLASVNAIGELLQGAAPPGNIATLPTIGAIGYNATYTGGPVGLATTPTGGSGQFLLPNGTYTVYGALSTSATISPALFSSGDALADFGPGGGGWTLNISATPNPNPVIAPKELPFPPLRLLIDANLGALPIDSAVPVPEPSSLVLGVVGLVGVAAFRLRRRFFRGDE